ncbi:MAG: Hsp20/alpha crystallin family protein [Pseudomonadales bacterium]|nr:Hsp20/alpha crystallin family protein [Pseudomonadales bacterium]
MNTLEQLSHNLKETLEGLSEGWHHLWQKARSAITRFTPFPADQEKMQPIATRVSRWGVLSAEVFESADELEVQLEVPGMASADFAVTVDKQLLSVRGEKRYQNDRRDGRYHVTERAYGSFERIIPLPVRVRDDAARARYHDGVLTITLPKAETEKTRRIPVQ